MDTLELTSFRVRWGPLGIETTGTIALEFRVGTDMEEALLKVNSRLQQVPEYPEDADEPVIRTSSSADRAIAWFILSQRMPERARIREFQREHTETAEELEHALEAHSPALAESRLRRAAKNHPIIGEELLPKPIEIATLRKYAEDTIETQFERVDGVSNSNVFGGEEPEMQVVVEPERLAARGLTVADVRRVLREQDARLAAAGKLAFGHAIEQ